MTLLLKVDDARGCAWKSLFEKHAPDIDVRFWPDIGDPLDVRYFAVWQPPVLICTINTLPHAFMRWGLMTVQPGHCC